MKLIVLHNADGDKPIYLNAELIAYVHGMVDDKGECTFISYGTNVLKVREDISKVVRVIIEEDTDLSAYSNKLYETAYEHGRNEVLVQIKNIKADIRTWIDEDDSNYDFRRGLKRALCIINNHV